MKYRHTSHMHSDYIDGALSSEDMAAVDRHIAECKQCREDFDQLKLLTQTLRRVGSTDPGPEYFENMTDIVLARTSSIAPETESPSVRVTAYSRRALLTMIKLAAAITLLFAAFYVSTFKEDQNASRWADKINHGTYVTTDTLGLEQNYKDPALGGQTDSISPAVDDTIAPEPKKPDK